MNQKHEFRKKNGKRNGEEFFKIRNMDGNSIYGCYGIRKKDEFLSSCESLFQAVSDLSPKWVRFDVLEQLSSLEMGW